MREQLAKFGGALMTLAAGGALGYLITSRATGRPAPHLTWPFWPYWLCLGMFAIGALLYGGAHGMLPWQKYSALRRRATAAESSFDTARTELADARRELDQARQELEEAKPAAIPASPGPEEPSKTGLEIVIDDEKRTPFPA